MIIQIEPWIGEEELEQLKEVVNSTFVTEWRKTEELEKKFKELTGAKYALAYCNATMGLFAGLLAINIKAEDEVIVPDLTFVASSNAVLLTGATPVFVDIDKKTFQISPDEIEKHITPRTKAIMPVHLYGQACDMHAILEIAKKYNLKVIEDAAQGIGVRFNGKHVGTFGDVGVFSLYGNKTLTTGEGGIVVSDNDNLSRRLYTLKNHGRMEKGTFIHEEIGFNFCFTEMQAGIGIAQLSKFDRIKKRKDEIRAYYERELKDIKELELTFIDGRCEPVHWFSSIMVPNVPALQEFLAKHEIQTRRFFLPLHTQPCYANMKFDEYFPNATYAYEHGLSLPSSALLSDEQLAEVVRRIKEFYKQ